MVSAHQTFLSSIRSADPVALFEPLSQLCHGNRTLAHAVWIDLFPQLWQQFSSEVRLRGSIERMRRSGKGGCLHGLCGQVGGWMRGLHGLRAGV